MFTHLPTPSCQKEEVCNKLILTSLDRMMRVDGKLLFSSFLGEVDPESITMTDRKKPGCYSLTTVLNSPSAPFLGLVYLFAMHENKPVVVHMPQNQG